MRFYKAQPRDLESVWNIVSKTICDIYPSHYCKEAVSFFLQHHSRQMIAEDIVAGIVYLLECGEKSVGTVTVKEDHINRMFVLPYEQGNGLGKQLISCAEDIIRKSYPAAVLDASIPGYGFYLHLGYEETETRSCDLENGRVLQWQQMRKEL